jgi:hypothetical protein
MLLQARSVTAFSLIAFFPVAALAYAPDFTGHTSVLSPTVDASIHFVVLDLNDLSDRALASSLAPAFIPGNASPAFDVGAGGFMYMYEPLNDAYEQGARALSAFTNSLGDSSSTPYCWGRFSGWSFTDGSVGLAPSPFGNVPDGPGGHLDGPPCATFGVQDGVQDLVAPSRVRIDESTGSIIARYDSSIPRKRVSEIVAFVSPDPPAWYTGSLVDGGQGGYGPTPAPMPEPATLLGTLLAALLARPSRSRP